MKRLAVFFTFYLLAILGCSVSNEQELIGKYNANYDFAHEVLVLKSDHLFEQTVRMKNTNVEIVHSGTWTLSRDKRLVNLQDPLIVEGEFGARRDDWRQPVRGVWALRVDRTLRDLSLNWNDDRDVRFVQER